MLRATIFGVVLATGIGLAAPALAQDYEAAGRHFTAGQEAFSRGQYNRAADEFEAAYQITKDPVLLYNIGEANERGGNGRAAVRSYRGYLTDAPQAADRVDVERKIAGLEDKYGLRPPPPVPLIAPPPRAPAPPLVVAPVAPPPVPAPVSPVPPAPPAPPVPPVSIIPPPAPVLVHPQPEKPIPTPAVDEEMPRVAPGGLLDDDKPSRTKTIAWIGVASAVALLTAGGILGLAAQSRSDEITRRELVVGPDGQPPKFDKATEDQFKELRSDGQTFDTVAIAMMTAAGVVAVTSGVLFYVDHRGRRKAAEGKRAYVAPSIGPRHAAIALCWEF
ncbi:MAG: hypothetical protein EXR72_06250 [Myxococcales bacterium]|nr:hypothetical protein [Myxococcales bacterium]